MRTIDAEAPAADGLELHRFPAQRDLRLPASDDSIELLELWSLRGCALHRLIADNNSSLGRLAQPSTRMFYEIDFLRLVPACIEALEQEGKTELASALAAAANSKQQRLPLLVWHGILGGPEYREYWQIPHWLGAYPETATQLPAEAALDSLSLRVERWLAGDYRLDRSAVEMELQRLLGGDGGALYKSVAMQHEYLGRFDLALAQRYASGPICRGTGGQRASILDTVVRKFFIGEIQPWSTRIQRRAFQLQNPRRLEQLLAAGEPQTFKEWRLARDGHIARSLEAPRRHVEALLPVMRQCGLAPST